MSLNGNSCSPINQLYKRAQVSRDSYTVAIIVPLAVELAPVRAVLDVFHEDVPTNRLYNCYILGGIGHHNVVIATLPATGNNESSSVATQLLNDFPAIRFGILVGVGGGVPYPADIRLGDVVVSEGTNSNGAVIQLDRGKRLGGESFEWTGHLNNPHPVLASAVKNLRARHSQQNPQLNDIITDMLREYPKMQKEYQMPDPAFDRLFEATYEHGGEDCATCDSTMVLQRLPRTDKHPRIHYGSVGSSNALIRSGTEREKIRERFKVLSVEMEAAGLMNVLPCLVVRGICDYADSHKNKMWQPYAAAAAAAYTKELLLTLPAVRLATTQPLSRNDITATKAETGALRPQEPEFILQALIRSLAFDRMEARLHNIEDAHPYTCQWLFEDDRYLAWIGRKEIKVNNGFFWIKGKPGSGKSTVMKSALDRLETDQNNEATLSYFFNARSPGQLEKSSFGLYRSVTHQILHAYPNTEQLFYKRFHSKCRVIVHEGVPPIFEVADWSEIELKNFIMGSTKLTGAKPLNVFIDALDEGEESDVRRLVDFLENLALSAIKHKVQLRVCLSSRHFPQIRIKKAFSLVLEDHPGHRADIEEYVNDKLDDIGADDEYLKAKICEKSAMVFLWVVLVIPMLRRAYDKGLVSEMLRYLEELPQDLETLFDEIMSRDLVNIDQCYKLLHIILFARRPLTMSELYVAIQLYKDGTTFELHKLPSDLILSRYLVDCSRGFVELTKSEPPTVQFVHELVRTFLRQHMYQWALGGRPVSWEAAGHNVLKTICFKYFQLMVSSEGCCPLDVNFIKQRGAFLPNLRRHFLLNTYVKQHMFAHADMARQYGVVQDKFLCDFLASVETASVETASGKDMVKWYYAAMLIKYHLSSISRDTLLLKFVDDDYFGLVADLLEHLPNCETTPRLLRDAIDNAASRGLHRTLSVLVDAGSALGLHPSVYDMALQSTPKMDEQCLKILVKQRATINSIPHSGTSSLQ